VGGGDPEPFLLEAGRVGCLLIHGFTGSPAEMRPVGEHLHARGMTVSGPLLPGHGTQAEDLNRVRWQDWVAATEDALATLRQRCDVVFVGGLSMGALLAAHLGALHPGLAGLVLYSPALRTANRLLFLAPLLRGIVPFFPTGGSDLTDPAASDCLWHYERYPVGGAAEMYRLQHLVRRELPDVIVPALVFYSAQDGSITPRSASLTHELLGSADKVLLTLLRSGHCLTVDAERDVVFRETWRFIAARIGEERL
jgi:carboxylesterase